MNTLTQYSGNKSKYSTKYWWMLAYFLFGSGIPLSLFLIEFHNGNPSGEYNEFIDGVVRAYSPLFIYACIAGFLLPFYIIPAYEYFNSAVTDEKIIKIRKRFIIAAVVVSVAVTIGDFFGGDAAIWEVRPPHHQSYVSSFVNLGARDMSVLENKGLVIIKRDTGNTRDTISITEAKIKYKEGIAQELKSVSNWSLTRYSYIFSILIEALFLNLFFYICFFYYSFRQPLKNKDESEFYKIVNGLIIASLLIFIWLLLRSMNSVEKEALYPDKDNQIANYAVCALNIICLFFITISRLANSKIRKLAEEIISIIAVLGIAIGSIYIAVKPAPLKNMFGKEAQYSNYIAFPIVFLLLYGAYYIINLGIDFDKKNDQQTTLIDEDIPKSS